MITKDEASDLKSHVDYLIECKMNFKSAELALKQATSQYEGFIWKLQQKPKE